MARSRIPLGRGGGGRWLPIAAGILGAIGVAIAAVVAHALQGWLTDRGLDSVTVDRRMGQAETAVRYHLIHCVVLITLFNARETLGRRATAVAASLMAWGILLFSGSLYALVLTNQAWLGRITPFGGAAWIAGWLVIAVSGYRYWRTA